MHPTISDLISDCFYRGTLKTHDDAIKRFTSEGFPFSMIEGAWMPEARIVFVDMPWMQAMRNASGEEGGSDGKRRYSNKTETEAACRALSQFLPVTGVKCHIQVLSPYRAQVRRLMSAISDEIASGKLKNLTAPEFDIWQPKRTGATVDEFQGSEAEVVVASLVRNNDEKVGKGLGFLADRRRVNVLLSRAQHKLILVGSWDFLASRVDCSVEPTEEEELAHIAKLMRWLDRERKSGRVARISMSQTYWGGAR
jgi:AAA domain